MRGIRIISNRILELYDSRRLPNAAHLLCFCLTMNAADVRLVGAFIILSIRGPPRNMGSQGLPDKGHLSCKMRILLLGLFRFQQKYEHSTNMTNEHSMTVKNDSVRTWTFYLNAKISFKDTVIMSCFLSDRERSVCRTTEKTINHHPKEELKMSYIDKHFKLTEEVCSIIKNRDAKKFPLERDFVIEAVLAYREKISHEKILKEIRQVKEQVIKLNQMVGWE